MMPSEVPPPTKQRRTKPKNRGATDQTSAVAIAHKERRGRALELRKSGSSYEEIAIELGYNDRSAAYKAVSEEIAKITREPAAELLHLEVARLDALLKGIWEKASMGEDIGALDVARKLIMDRAKMLGLVTQKVEIQPPPREAMWERVAGWLAEPTEELEAALRLAGWERVGRPVIDVQGEAANDVEPGAAGSGSG